MKYAVYALLLAMVSGYYTTPLIAGPAQKETPQSIGKKRAELHTQTKDITDLADAAKTRSDLQTQVDKLDKLYKAEKDAWKHGELEHMLKLYISKLKYLK